MTWKQRASCLNYPSEWWTLSEKAGRSNGKPRLTESHYDAIHICEACPVKVPCREYAKRMNIQAMICAGEPRIVTQDRLMDHVGELEADRYEATVSRDDWWYQYPEHRSISMYYDLTDEDLHFEVADFDIGEPSVEVEAPPSEVVRQIRAQCVQGACFYMATSGWVFTDEVVSMGSWSGTVVDWLARPGLRPVMECDRCGRVSRFRWAGVSVPVGVE